MTKCERYYKVRQEAITKWDKKSLQSTTIIIKCDNYHKVRRNAVDTCGKVSFLIKFQARPEAVYKRTPSQVFSCEFWDIFKKNFFAEHLWVNTYECSYALLMSVCVFLVDQCLNIRSAQNHKDFSINLFWLLF